MAPELVAVPLKTEWMRKGSFHATELMDYCLDSLETRYPEAEWVLEAIQPEDFLAWFRLRK